MTDIEKMNLCLLAGMACDAVKNYTSKEDQTALEKAISRCGYLLTALTKVRQISTRRKAESKEDELPVFRSGCAGTRTSANGCYFNSHNNTGERE